MLKFFSNLKMKAGNKLDGYFVEKLNYGDILANTARVYNGVETYQEKGKNSADWKKAYSQIDVLLADYEKQFGFLSIYIIDKQSGRAIYASGTYKSMIEGSDYSSAPYYSESIVGQQVISEFTYSEIIKTNYVTVATPIKRGATGDVIGTINAYLPVQPISDMIHNGMDLLGSSADSYLIDPQGLLYTNTKIGAYSTDGAFKQNIVSEAQEMLSPHISSGDTAYSNSGIYKDYTGKKVVGAQKVVKIGKTNLGFVVEVAEAEAMAATKSLLYVISGLVMAVVVLSVGIALYISGIICKPIIAINELMGKASEGDLSVRGDLVSQDEIGELTSSFNNLLEKTGETMRQIQSSTEMLNQSAADMERVSNSMAASSEETSSKVAVVSSAVEQISASMTQSGTSLASTSQNTTMIASAVEEMSSTIRNLASASEETSAGAKQSISLMGNISGNINQVSTFAKEVTNEVNNVVNSVREVNASVNEVSKNCNNSMKIASDAATKAEITNSIIQKLNQSSNQIGKIIEVINDIADQTNMLALNATIEAAGAGEAGKGFAVVANEVKELAKQTAESTDEISQQIEDMQGNMQEAVKAVADITKVIEEISSITNIIADSVTEQSTATDQIASVATNTASRVSEMTKEIEAIEISKSIQEINTASNEVSRGASSTSVSAANLMELSSQLKTLVEQFKL